MIRKSPISATDLSGFSRLAIDATTGLTDLVEAMHHNIASVSSVVGVAPGGRTTGITGLVYRTVRGITRLVGGGIDALLGQLAPLLGQSSSTPAREAVLAALNGVLGDYLAATGNSLQITMRLRSNGLPLELTAQSLAAAAAQSGRNPGKVVILVHGLCMNDLQWTREGHDHGVALARDLGYTPVYLHYNSGLHISSNGRELAQLLESLVNEWPVPITDLVIIGHSMGGLVARSACHVGRESSHAWPRTLRKLVFLGTPHHGAPLARGGHWIDIILGVSPYTAPFARLGKIRSAGITDLRYGYLLDEDWAGRDRFAPINDRRQAVPLADGVLHYALAATTAASPRGAKGRLPGDGLVPVASALGRHADPRRSLALPEANVWIAHSMGHLDMLGSKEVYQQISHWLAA